MSLILQDNIGVVVDHNGKLSHSGEGNLSWSEAPSCVVIQPPYALARLSRFIEVSVFPLSTSCLTEISCLRVTHETISFPPLQSVILSSEYEQYSCYGIAGYVVYQSCTCDW